MNKTQDDITWKAIYTDGSYLNQFESGVEHKYPDIDRDRLSCFSLLKAGKVIHSTFIQKDQRLIYRRRTLIVMRRNDLGEQDREVIYLVGYQTTIGGQNFVVLNYIYHDGRVELDNSRDNIELYEQERF